MTERSPRSHNSGLTLRSRIITAAAVAFAVSVATGLVVGGWHARRSVETELRAALASATLGVGKTAEGLEAIKWWRQGKLLEIAEYCCFDVKCTKLVHEYGHRERKLFYTDKTQQRKSMPIEWS